MAYLLTAAPPPELSDQPDVALPSSWMSFEEFLLQWPCEVELPLDLDDTAFIEEAYRAILLRESDPSEMDQYLKLLQNASISKEWIIEDLLASEEFHSLERQLRVIWGRYVITEPGSSGEEWRLYLALEVAGRWFIAPQGGTRGHITRACGPAWAVHLIWLCDLISIILWTIPADSTVPGTSRPDVAE
jgi:hypothetical protein